MISKYFVRMFTVSAVLATALATGCASTPPPTEKMARSKSALLHAEEAGARNHAPLEYYKAMKKYEQADNAIAREDYKAAALLAEEAEVDANLAKAKAESNKAKASVEQLRESIKTLREELDRTNAN